MGFKSILTIWDGRDESRGALDRATGLARASDGHLNVLCLGFDRIQPGLYYAGATPVVFHESLESAQEEARKSEASVNLILKGSDVNWSCRSAVTQINGVYNLVGLAARYNDLVVLPAPYANTRGPEAAASVEAAMFHGRAPVLVCPKTDEAGSFRRIVVAWNQSAEAMAAVRAALPILSQAEAVDIAIVDPAPHGEDQADPGAELSRMLARHGPDVGVSVLARTVPKIAEVLERHAMDFNAELVVMGAYGHSRFRESILGGVTRDVLEDVGIPVLMAH